jgi:hypothetical protein
MIGLHNLAKVDIAEQLRVVPRPSRARQIDHADVGGQPLGTPPCTKLGPLARQLTGHEHDLVACYRS